MPDLVAIGRAGVDLYSLDLGASLEKAKRFAKYVGGTAANTVVGASRLGLRTALVSRVSNDELGAFVVDFLRAEGVDVSHVTKDQNRKTGIVFAEIAPGRDGKFVFYRENVADLWVRRSDIPRGLLEEARTLLVTGTGLSQEPSLGTVLWSAKSMKSLGKEVVFNLDWRPSLWDVSEAERLRRYRKMGGVCDVTIGNQGEYLAATGAGDLEAAVGAIRNWGVKTVVITGGEKGSESRSGTKTSRAPGFSVPLLKGLGGGDGFIAGFLFGRLGGWGEQECCIFGNAVGAIVVRGHACSESMPTLAEARKFLKENGYAFSETSGPSKH